VAGFKHYSSSTEDGVTNRWLLRA